MRISHAVDRRLVDALRTNAGGRMLVAAIARLVGSSSSKRDQFTIRRDVLQRRRGPQQPARPAVGTRVDARGRARSRLRRVLPSC